MDDITRADIWAKLSKVDSKKLTTEKFGGVEYIPWMVCHAVMMDQYPEYTWEFSEDATGREVHYFDDGSAEVRCKMTVEGHTNITSLPVYKNLKAITNPSSWDINSAKQRCRVKALAEFGLFHSLWDKDNALSVDAPVSAKPEQPEKEPETPDSIWESNHDKFMSAKTLPQAKKYFETFQNALRTRGLTDSNPNRQQDYLSELKKRSKK